MSQNEIQENWKTTSVMQQEEREAIDKCMANLVDDVIPSDTLSYLPCLTDGDREAIECKEENKGPRSAVRTLLDRLKKRPNAYGQFLEALARTGCEHLKDLLENHVRQVSQLPQKDCEIATGKEGVETEEVTGNKKDGTEMEERSPTFKSQLSHPSQETDIPGFDILVCYGPTDKNVALEMKTIMQKEYDLRVCIDEIDFIPGKAHSQNICEFISYSKTVVFLLSQDFLDKRWAEWEMQHAVFDSLGIKDVSARKKIIPILLKKCNVPYPLKPYTLLDFQECRDWKRLATAVGENTRADTIPGNCGVDPSELVDPGSGLGTEGDATEQGSSRCDDDNEITSSDDAVSHDNAREMTDQNSGPLTL